MTSPPSISSTGCSTRIAKRLFPFHTLRVRRGCANGNRVHARRAFGRFRFELAHNPDANAPPASLASSNAHSPNDYSVHMAVDPERYHALTLIERIDFSDDLAVFRLRAPEPVDFTPGQYATIGLLNEENDRPLLRPYSVASVPGTTDLEFFIERVEDGDLTPRLWSLERGAEVWMRKKVVGRFVLNRDRRYHVMAATVTGVGPYVSIARHQKNVLEAGEQDEPNHFLILHGASRSWELGTYRQELSTLADRHGWIDYVPTVSRPWEDPDWRGERGRVEDVLRKHLDASAFPIDQTAAYTCGHPKMIDKAQGIFRRAGIPEETIHEEKYFVERSG